MGKIVWTDDAITDLKEIHDYISLDSLTAASRLSNSLVKRVEILQNYPESGRVVPEFGDKRIRELIKGNYRIVYRIVSEIEINILRIHHSARQLLK
ncbi:addiction module toxin, RelE/StbE family [Ekhidna lutea]|uniref:Addiction module toxin, RelE/StbE family n=1 Tax=Ekhidna lutea TaxID=447679 RepID=A0A239HEN8_EKHLU|nr:type II toxin-antitoxin system RelE/ParE family toxin [Ekhidna lutea]SNS79886.1 addiction module toxin, RelE/StbE family [Ekhidna lutea]